MAAQPGLRLSVEPGAPTTLGARPIHPKGRYPSGVIQAACLKIDLLTARDTGPMRLC
jgi:hypothetical protein